MGSDRVSIVTIREFRIEDFEALVALWTDARLPFRPQGRDRRDRIAREIEGASAVFLVAEVDGRIVGSIFGTHDGRKGWINRLAVSPIHRRQGVAARLVEEIERRLSCRGIEIVACLIEEWNALSMEVFERLGYTRHPDVHYFSKRRHPDV